MDKGFYTEEYYRSHLSKSNIPYDRSQDVWQEFFSNVAKNIQQTLFPKKVIEFGCAKGFLVEALWNAGIQTEGIDVSEYAISQVPEHIRPFCRVGSVLEPLPVPKRYDLAVCIEVLEHLQEHEGMVAIKNITRCSNTVLFSSTPDDFDEPTHVNVHPKEYWVHLFEKEGFQVDELYDAGYVASHAMLFRNAAYQTDSSKRLKVLCVMADYIASSQIRLFSPLNLLERDRKVQCRVIIARKETFRQEYIDWCDIVVFQRVKDKRWFQLLKYANRTGKITIYDIDDNLLRLPSEHPEYQSNLFKRFKYQRRYVRFLRHARAVTVSTQPLADSFSKLNRNVFVLPNYVDADFFNAVKADGGKDNSAVTIGYFGTPTHEADFRDILAALTRVVAEYKDRVKLLFMGYLPSMLAAHPQTQFVGFKNSYSAWARDLSSMHIDFAIAPLKANDFNHCKSNIKFLEYSICGIPAIYSNVAPYQGCVRQSCTGFLVGDSLQESWYQAIKLFIDSPELRRKIGESAHRCVRENFLIQDHYMEWFELYTKLLSDERKN